MLLMKAKNRSENSKKTNVLIENSIKAAKQYAF